MVRCRVELRLGRADYTGAGSRLQAAVVSVDHYRRMAAIEASTGVRRGEAYACVHGPNKVNIKH